MLTRLKLAFFQRHEDLDISFTNGLQVIRGRNEQGKSTLFRAVAYAFSGSRALPQTLEETVTWDHPVSALQVELWFTHNQQSYYIRRRKSGAELTGAGVTASGQAEVTAFVENLFNASASTMQATMMINQKALTASLEKGSLTLIEKLANVSLIDELIDKVQTRLPSGNTKALEALVSGAEEEKPVLDLGETEKNMQRELEHVEEAEALVSGLTMRWKATKVLADEGLDNQRSNEATIKTRAMLNQQLAIAKAATVLKPFTPHNLEELREKIEQQKMQKQNAEAWEAFKDLLTSRGDTWGDEKTFRENVVRLDKDKATVYSAIAECNSKIAVKNALRVTADTCGLCGKDVSEIPEVIASTARLDAEVEELQGQLTQLREDLTKLLAQQQVYDDVLSRNVFLDRQLPLLNVVHDKSIMPLGLTWVGPASVEVDHEDYTARLRTWTSENQAHEKAVMQASSALSHIAVLKTQLDSLFERTITKEQLKAMLVIDQFAQELQQATETLNERRQLVTQLGFELKHKRQMHQASMDAWQAGVAKRAEVLALLDNYIKNNTIIRKLKDARPVVARELWALVLTGVSQVFSQIRDEASTVTRTEDGFLVDGKSFAAYSGSAQDSLGLAIRLVLQRTFLPSIDFMLVDEPGAAADEARETLMLAQLATSGLEQVILVTHSDLADSFAANIIQL